MISEICFAGLFFVLGLFFLQRENRKRWPDHRFYIILTFSLGLNIFAGSRIAASFGSWQPFLEALAISGILAGAAEFFWVNNTSKQRMRPFGYLFYGGLLLFILLALSAFVVGEEFFRKYLYPADLLLLGLLVIVMAALFVLPLWKKRRTGEAGVNNEFRWIYWGMVVLFILMAAGRLVVLAESRETGYNFLILGASALLLVTAVKGNRISEQKPAETAPLPQLDAPGPEVPEDLQPLSSVSGDKPDILVIIEKEPLLQEQIKRLLAQKARLYFFSSCQEASVSLDMIPKPELVIMKKCDDRKSGLKLLNRLMPIDGNLGIPFLFFTNRISREDKIRMTGNRGIEYLKLPSPDNIVSEKLGHLLQLPRENEVILELEAVETKGGESASDKWEDFKKNCLQYNITDRQMEIALLISRGLEYRVIAAELDISINTVIRHVQNLYEKLEVKNKVELINRLFT